MTSRNPSWTSHASIIRLHKLRWICHMALLALSAFLLVSTSVVLAYSIKMYYGSFLHAIPELMTASVIVIVVIGLSWLPSNEYVGLYGLKCMRSVLQEIIWSGSLSLMIFAGVTSLHQSTPGLMRTCGKFFICRGYIAIFVAAWFSWLAISLPFGLLLSAAIYQATRRQPGKPVWSSAAARFEYFWPGESAKKSIGSSAQRLSRHQASSVVHPDHVNPNIASEKSVTGPDGFERA